MNRMITPGLLLMFAAASATRVASDSSQAGKNDNNAKAGTAPKDSIRPDSGPQAADSTPKTILSQYPRGSSVSPAHRRALQLSA